MHIRSFKINLENQIENNKKKKIDIDSINIEKKSDFKNKDTINQIKNITQEKNTKPEFQDENKIKAKISINSFDDLLNICIKYKEVKLRYELEKNVNLVRFERNRIEISFNDDLDKDFVKNLSSKLFEWTNERWIITFSKLQGELSIKERKKSIEKKNIDNEKKSKLYKEVLNNFPDANLIKVSDDHEEN